MSKCVFNVKENLLWAGDTPLMRATVAEKAMWAEIVRLRLLTQEQGTQAVAEPNVEEYVPHKVSFKSTSYYDYQVIARNESEAIDLARECLIANTDIPQDLVSNAEIHSVQHPDGCTMY